MREDNNGILLRAKTIYLYLGGCQRVSRSSRMQWFLDHLDSVISLPIIENLENLNKPIQVLSAVPEPQAGVAWSAEVAHLFQYYVHPRTQLFFLSKRNCLTYCLDMSPSLSAVEIQSGEVLLDKVYTSLKTSLEGVSRYFVLPGSRIIFYPEIYVSIIVNTPFFTTPAQQVLVQSWRVTSQNLPELCRAVLAGLVRLETAVAQVAQLEQPAVRPDQGFINMLRFGMLALRLLPIASVAGIVVVTDGVITLPDAWLLDATLNRFRSTGVACHFLHVGSPFHPHVAHGRVPYKDLMTFLSAASLGTHFTSIREASILDFRDLQMNHFHRAFLAWTFQEFQPKDTNTDILPQSFCLDLLRKKQIEESLAVSLTKLLCCRIREGYVITNMNLSETQVEISLHLLWKHNTYIEYSMVSKWPPTSSKVHYAIHIRAPYEFVHDITCPKTRFQAPFRQAAVSRFFLTMKNIAQSDYLLVHLHSKENNSSWNVVPDSIRSGMPLFHLSSNGGITTSDVTNTQFAMFWKPISLLDPEAWHKWLHVCRIGILLRHDCPLPKHLHLRNSSGRFQSVQCRQSATALQTLLRDDASFVLVENQTFVKLDDSTFWIIRITGKPPCVVIHIAFPCGVAEERRAEIALGMRGLLSELSCPWRASPHARRRQPSRANSRISCCLVLQKPVEKILVRYERAPTTFETVVFPDGTQPSISAKVPERTAHLVTTLSRYLHHKRWIWEASVGTTALARILSTLTKLRLQEGFSFAHSQAGVVTMLLEAEAGEGEDTGAARCVIQYVLFPPHCDSEDEEAAGCLVTESWVEPHSGLLRGLPYHRLGSSFAASDAICISAMLTFEHLSLMARDRSVNIPTKIDEIEKMNTPIRGALSAIHKPVNGNTSTPISKYGSTPTSFLTPPTEPSRPMNAPLLTMDLADSDTRIQHVPLLFDIIQLLPLCRQAELLFSMPVQDWQVPGKIVDTNSSLMELILEVLGNLNDRDILLSEKESLQFTEHLHRRDRGSDNGPLLVPKPEIGKEIRWRLFVRAYSPVHIYLTIIPATYADLKLITDENKKNEDKSDLDNWIRLREPSRSVSIEPQPSLDSLDDISSPTQSLKKTDIDRVAPFVISIQKSLDNVMTPQENFRLRASSLDTNLERSRRAARMNFDDKYGGNQRTASLEAKQVAALEISSWSSHTTELDPPDTKIFATIPLPIFIYDCPLDNLIDSLLYRDFQTIPTENTK